MNVPGYESLAEVLQAAYAQAATGKGKERHANDLPFDKQPMQQIARRRGVGFLLGQADKKTEEAQGMLERGDRDAWRREILGAINYLAGALVFTRGEQPAPTVPDSPVWFTRHTGPNPGRRVEVEFKDRSAVAVLVWSGMSELGPQVSRWRYLDESEPPAPPESDSPVWFGRDVVPEAGRVVVWEIPGDEFRADRWGEGEGWSSQCLRWRYVD